MKKIIGIGEILWDLLPEGKQPGGAPGNFAYHAMQLGFESYAISAIGNDDLGDEIADFLESKNLKTILNRVDFPTGVVEVTLNSGGVPSYNICENVAWDNIPFTHEMENLAKETNAVCFGTLAMRNSVSHKSINDFIDLVPASSYKIFDINLRQHYYTKELIENCLCKCNIFKINDDEIRVLMNIFSHETNEKSFCAHLIEKYNLNILILTKGENGSVIMTKNGEISEKPTPKVDVIDTVGAGDAFTAAFIGSIMNGGSIFEAHTKAVEVSAFVCSRKGAMPDY